MGLSRRDREELMNGTMSPRKARGMVTFSMLFASFWVLGVGIAVAVRGNSTVCIAALRWPTLYVGIAFMVVSLFGCFCCCAATRIGCCPKNFFLVGLFFVLLVLSVVVVFSHVAVSGKYWGTISVCLRHRNTCDGMSLLTISRVQSGCCKPPSSCAFTYVNGTTWSPPTAGAGGAPAAVDEDCSRWSNDQRTLCFQCDSCKASVVGHIKGVWNSGPGIWTTGTTVICVLLYYPTVQAYRECEK